MVDDCPLTPRQREFMDLAIRGYSYEQIAATLGIARSTVSSLLYECRRRLGVENRGGGAAFAVMLSHGWVRPRDVTPEAYSSWLQSTKHDLNWRPSAAQRCYLNAFDRLLWRRDPASAYAVDLAFRLMCHEAGVREPAQRFDAETAVEHLEESLLRMAVALRRTIPV